MFKGLWQESRRSAEAQRVELGVGWVLYGIYARGIDSCAAGAILAIQNADSKTVPLVTQSLQKIAHIAKGATANPVFANIIKISQVQLIDHRHAVYIIPRDGLYFWSRRCAPRDFLEFLVDLIESGIFFSPRFEIRLPGQ